MQRFKVSENINTFKTIASRTSAAKALCVRLEKQLLSGYNPLFVSEKITTQLTISECVCEAAESRYKRLRRKSKETYESKVTIFCDWLDVHGHGDKHVSFFSEALADQFLDYISYNRKGSATTRNAYLITLKSLFGHIVKKGFLEKNPFDGVVELPETRMGKLPFREAQKEKLRKELSENHPELWLFVQFIYYCFIRPGELRDLKCGAIDVDNGQILVDAHISKTGKAQYVSIPYPLLSQIIARGLHLENPDYYIFGRNQMPGDKQVLKDYFNKQHKTITRKFGMPPRYTLYSWKPTGVLAATRALINIKEIQMQLRHSSLQTTDIYLKSLGIKDMNDFVGKMPTL